MEESCPWEGAYCDRGGLLLCGRKGRCSPRLIVVLEEAKQLLLVGEVSTEMKPNPLCIVMLQAIIEPLVVAEVEPLLLQLPLQVPVSLGNEAEVWMRSLDGRDHVTPVLGCRPLPCTTAPGAFEDLVQQKHGHIATDAIALSRDTGHGFNYCLPK